MGWRERAAEKLRKSGLRLTPQRIRLLEVIERLGPAHPTLKQVLEEVRIEVPTVSFSTLYSNILKLRDLGLLEIFQAGGETRVELNPHPHINLINGEIRDLDSPEVIKEIERMTGRKVRLVNVLLEPQTNPAAKQDPPERRGDTATHPTDTE